MTGPERAPADLARTSWRRRIVLRSLVGAALGVGWYAVLLLPEFTRRELLGENERAPLRMMALMMLASCLLTLATWPAAARPRKLWLIVLAPVVPVVGALTFSALVFATDFVPVVPELFGPNENPHGWIDGVLGGLFGLLYMFMIGVPMMAWVALQASLYVALPMGLFHLAFMRFVARSSSSRPPVGSGASASPTASRGPARPASPRLDAPAASG